MIVSGIDPLTLSIGIGLVVCLLFVDYLGLTTGGMVVPGYIALDMTHAGTVVLTLVDALIIYAFMQFLSRYFIIYGRRRIALIMLIAFLFGALLRTSLASVMVVSHLGQVYTIIGYIIPGLIALSMDRQGIIETITSVLSAAVVVRLILIILLGTLV